MPCIGVQTCSFDQVESHICVLYGINDLWILRLVKYFVAKCNAVITSDQAVRGGKVIELKRTVDAAVASCPSIQHVFVTQRTGADVPCSKIDVPLEKVSCRFTTHIIVH